MPNLQLAPFSSTPVVAADQINLFVRHDIDTATCMHNMAILLDIDRKFNFQSGVYFRVDDEEYSLSDHKDEIQTILADGFEVGLHSVCYIEDNYMEAFRRETEKFTREAGFRPKSFTVHGLGQFRLDVRLKFYDEIADRLDEFGYEFSDCCSKLRSYDYVIEDCHWDETKKARYIKSDFFRLSTILDYGKHFLILTHPSYWQA